VNPLVVKEADRGIQVGWEVKRPAGTAVFLEHQVMPVALVVALVNVARVLPAGLEDLLVDLAACRQRLCLRMESGTGKLLR
jgi:hypothetical protein